MLLLQLESSAEQLLSHTFLTCRSTLSRVCKRWRALCLSAPELWESVWLTAPGIAGSSNDRSRQQWLEGKLWLLQVRCGECSVGVGPGQMDGFAHVRPGSSCRQRHATPCVPLPLPHSVWASACVTCASMMIATPKA